MIVGISKRDCLSLDDTANLLGVSRGTLHKYMKLVNVQGHKFQLDKKMYVTLEDVEKLKQFLQEIS